MRGKQNKKQKSWMILLHTEVFIFFFCFLLFVYFLSCVCITDTFINIKFLIIF